MIEQGLDLSKAGEVFRINAFGAMSVKIRGIRELLNAGVVELRRAWGEEGPTDPYSPAKTLDLSGDAPTEIQVEDCSHIAVVVTTPGSGSFDLEWNTQGVRQSRLTRLSIDLSNQGEVWSGHVLSRDQVATIVANVSETSGSPAIGLLEYLDPDSQGYSTESLTLDGSPTTVNLSAIDRIGLVVITADADIMADIWIFYSSSIESIGMVRDP